jgi:hypothetical protein
MRVIDRSRKAEPPKDPELVARKRELYERMKKGDDIIIKAKKEGKDTTAWEDGWIRLLREYEQVCKALGERHEFPE